MTSPVASGPSNEELQAGDGRGSGPSAIILVVERDPHIRELEAYFLGEAGYGVECAIKSDPLLGHTAVLVFSILAAERRARESGADAFLMKPLADRRLVDTVRELVAQRRASSSPTPDGAR